MSCLGRMPLQGAASSPVSNPPPPALLPCLQTLSALLSACLTLLCYSQGMVLDDRVSAPDITVDIW